MSEFKCTRCDGCGQIANSEEGEPWTAWEQLPPGSDLAVRLGVVRPIECPSCGGSGKLTVEVTTVEAGTPHHPGATALSVLQDWLQHIPLMQQTVLLTAVRGPDGQPKYGPVKYLLRWYRRCILVSSLDHSVISDPHDDTRGGSFMGQSVTIIPEGLDDMEWAGPVYLSKVGGGYRKSWQEAMDDVVSAYLRDVDAIPHHFQLHFMHAAEIVGFKHPDPEIRAWWNAVYARLVHDMHLHPEAEDEMDRRLGDDRAGWLERADPATVA